MSAQVSGTAGLLRRVRRGTCGGLQPRLRGPVPPGHAPASVSLPLCSVPGSVASAPTRAQLLGLSVHHDPQRRRSEALLPAATRPHKTHLRPAVCAPTWAPGRVLLFIPCCTAVIFLRVYVATDNMGLNSPATPFRDMEKIRSLQSGPCAARSKHTLKTSGPSRLVGSQSPAQSPGQSPEQAAACPPEVTGLFLTVTPRSGK